MKTLKNDNFTVNFTNDKDFEVTNKFGDTYKCSINENGKVVSKTQLGLKYAMTARQQLGF